jgi:hypothetical protein
MIFGRESVRVPIPVTNATACLPATVYNVRHAT